MQANHTCADIRSPLLARSFSQRRKGYKLFAGAKVILYIYFLLFIVARLANMIQPGSIKKINKMKTPFMMVGYSGSYFLATSHSSINYVTTAKNPRTFNTISLKFNTARSLVLLANCRF